MDPLTQQKKDEIVKCLDRAITALARRNQVYCDDIILVFKETYCNPKTNNLK